MKTLYIHSGSFHGDDVVCAALMTLAFPNCEIIRVNTLPADVDVNANVHQSDVIAADIGFGIYDHHQADCPRMKDGVKYAACGRLFEDLEGTLFKGKKAPKLFMEELWMIQYVDNNGPQHWEFPLSTIVRNSRPAWDSDMSMDSAFMECVNFAVEVWLRPWTTGSYDKALATAAMQRKLDRMKESNDAATERATSFVRPFIREAEMKGKDFIVLPRFAPWQPAAKGTSIKFCVFQNERGINISCNQEKGALLPKAWLTEKPDGCKFVHQGLFMASFSSIDAAVAALS